MAIDYKFYDNAAYFIYLGVMALLVVVLVAGKTVAGSKSWLGVGGFGIQPSEFAKTATCLALARYLADPSLKLDTLKEVAQAGIIIGIPALLILSAERYRLHPCLRQLRDGAVPGGPHGASYP